MIQIQLDPKQCLLLRILITGRANRLWEDMQDTAIPKIALDMLKEGYAIHMAEMKPVLEQLEEGVQESLATLKRNGIPDHQYAFLLNQIQFKNPSQDITNSSVH